MYAVVATGGKQLRVAKDDVIVVEKLDKPVGESVTFDVLFVADGDKIAVGAEDTGSAIVKGEVVEHFRGDKAVIFKFKKRKGYKRLKGHRQEQTRVRITDVALSAPKKAAAKKKVAAEVSAETETAE